MYQDMAYGKTGTMRLVNDNDTIVSSANKSEIGTQMDERLTEALLSPLETTMTFCIPELISTSVASGSTKYTPGLLMNWMLIAFEM